MTKLKTRYSDPNIDIPFQKAKKPEGCDICDIDIPLVLSKMDEIGNAWEHNFRLDVLKPKNYYFANIDKTI